MGQPRLLSPGDPERSVLIFLLTPEVKSFRSCWSPVILYYIIGLCLVSNWWHLFLNEGDKLGRNVSQCAF